MYGIVDVLFRSTEVVFGIILAVITRNWWRLEKVVDDVIVNVLSNNAGRGEISRIGSGVPDPCAYFSAKLLDPA